MPILHSRASPLELSAAVLYDFRDRCAGAKSGETAEAGELPNLDDIKASCWRTIAGTPGLINPISGVCCTVAAGGQPPANPATPEIKSRRRIACSKARTTPTWVATRSINYKS